MTKFLERTAEFIVQNHLSEISDLCIILPNRRGGLYLKKYIAQKLKQPIWSPTILSIEDFYLHITGLTMIDSTDALFELYAIYKEEEGKEAQPFEEFLSWGEQLLKDFSDIDNYLADPKQVFSYLSDAKAITLWNLDHRPLTDFQQKYLSFYRSLFPYYEKFVGRLRAKGRFTSGYLARYVSENCNEFDQHLEFSQIIFAGFNALTKAEERIIDHLVNQRGALVFWDSDTYYLNDYKQEAGEFLRDWRKRWGTKSFQWTEDAFAQGRKKIDIVGVPLHVGQVKYAGQILERFVDEAEDTAVVLMDEKLLFPLLNSIPNSIKDINVTMGLPLRNSNLYNLMFLLFELHERAKSYSREGTSSINPRFHLKDLLAVLQHPLVIELSQTRDPEVKQMLVRFISSLKSQRKVFWTFDHLLQIIQPQENLKEAFFLPFIAPWTNVNDALEQLKVVIDLLRQSTTTRLWKSKDKEYQMELEYLFAYSKIIVQISSLVSQYDVLKNIATLRAILDRVADTTSFSFAGEPLKGLQIMGMLETRTLDFKNLILLSTNEDLIPSGKSQNSFIPFDIRKEFSLPTHYDKNAVYAYHFYRLLERAENVTIMYNTEPDDLGGGEKSRFIQQLILELPQVNKEVEISRTILTTPPSTHPLRRPITVEKDSSILDKLEELAAKGLSPSSLNAYRKCKLRFYFSQIAGIQEPEEQSETIDPQILGQAVHDVLMNLFHPYRNIEIQGDDYQKMRTMIEEYTQKAFEKYYNGSDTSYGKNHLLVHVAKLMVANYLKAEKAKLEDVTAPTSLQLVTLLEQRLSKVVQIPFREDVLPVQLKGFVDRVDFVDDRYRIIDYKTGFADKRELEIDDWERLLDDPAFDKSFQLLLYAWLLHTSLEDDGKVITSEGEEITLKNVKEFDAGIISLRKIKNGWLNLCFSTEPQPEIINQERLTRFETVLMQIVTEIFNKNVSFSQAEDNAVCLICPYINVCQR